MQNNKSIHGAVIQQRRLRFLSEADAFIESRQRTAESSSDFKLSPPPDNLTGSPDTLND